MVQSNRASAIFVAIIFLCITVVTSFFTYQFFSTKLFQVNWLSEKLQSSTMQARFQLVDRMNEAIEEFQRLRVYNENSIRSFASFVLEQNIVDQFEIYDSTSCSLLSKATLDKNIKQNCVKNQSLPEGLFWELNDLSDSVLGVRKILSKNEDESKLLLIAKVNIDKIWLRTYPQLSSQLLNAGMSMKPILNKNSVVIEDNDVTVNQMSNFFPLGLIKSRENLYWLKDLSKSIFIITCLMMFIIVFTLYLNVKNHDKKVFDLNTEFFVWCRDLIKNHIHPTQKDRLRKSKLFNDERYKSWCMELLDIQQEENIRSNELILDYNLKVQENVKLNDQIEKFRQKIGVLSENKELARSICQLAPRLLSNNEQLTRFTKIIMEESLNQINDETTTLIDLINEWERGLNEQGSRKFIRTLCERTSSTGAKHLLEENVQSLITLSNSIFKHTNLMNNNIKKLFLQKDHITKVLNHWIDLSFYGDKQHSVRSTYKMEEILAFVEIFYELTYSKNKIKFDISHELKKIKFNWIPNSVMISFFERLIHLFLAGDNYENNKIMIRNKIKNEYFHLFVSIENNVLRNSNSSFSDYQSWDDIKNLLVPYEIEINIIPSRENSITVSLAWKLNEDIESQNIKQKQCKIIPEKSSQLMALNN